MDAIVKRRDRGHASDFVENLAPDQEEDQDHRAPVLSYRTYYRWRSEYGGLKGEQVKRLKEFEAENARLRWAMSDLMLGKMSLS